jgi:5-methylcytosine-specific restriction endonuclease McrA
VHYEPVDRRKIFARDQWICQLCLGPVNPASTHPKWRASLDHILPMSRGGTHTYANLQLAHVSCNSRKHANVHPGPPTLPPL